MKEIMEKLMVQLGYKTQKKFAEDIGVTEGRLSSFLSGRTKYPTLDILANIKEKFPQVNLNALMGYDGPLLFSEEEVQEQQEKRETNVPQSWQRFLEQLQKENEHLREQNKQFMQLLQEQRDKP